MLSTSSGRSAGYVPSPRSNPSIRNVGGNPTNKCKSEALFLIVNASNSLISIVFLFLCHAQYFFYCRLSGEYFQVPILFHRDHPLSKCFFRNRNTICPFQNKTRYLF